MGGFTKKKGNPYLYKLRVLNHRYQCICINTGIELSQTEILHDERIHVQCTKYNLFIMLALFKHWEY